MIKMLVMDIDGTFLRKDFTYSDEFVKMLERIKNIGIKPVIATGRMYKGAVPLAEELNLNTPIICYQGSVVRNYKENDEFIYRRQMTKEQAKKVIAYLRSKDVHINTYINDSLYVEQDDEHVKEYVFNRFINYNLVPSLDDLDLGNLDKILFIEHDQEKINSMVEELREMFKGELFIIKSMAHYCEITHIDATKGKAILALCEHWGIDIRDVMAVGDQDNDIEMIKTAGIGVAMGNATQGLKDVADFITKTVDDDGIVYVVEKFVGV